MRSYGLPRDKDIPFLADCREFALKTSAGGDCFKNKIVKRQIRRYFKRLERSRAKIEIKTQNDEIR